MKINMKYAAIVRYIGGQTDGYTVTAGSTEEAWGKLLKEIPLRNVQSVEMSMLLMDERELK